MSGRFRYALAILTVANFVNYTDRMVLSVVLENVKHALVLSDTQVGLLAGAAFALFYGIAGLAIARLADRYNRTHIIAWSMLIWSVLTAITGAAQNFTQLFLARIGVGVGEAAVIPTANAMLADYVEPAKRPAALAVFSSGATLGITSGLALGGWIATFYGWRWAFALTGIPGIPLAWLVYKTLHDPPRGLSDGKTGADEAAVSLYRAVKVLWSCRTYVHLVVGACFVNFILFGVVQWMPTFVIRKFGLNAAQVGFYFGTAVGMGAAAGSVLGGLVTSRLARGDVRWLVRVPLIVSLFYLPLYEMAIFSTNVATTVTLVLVINVVGSASFGPMLAAIQSVVVPSMRATAAAFYGFTVSLIGVGAAPFLIGILSDELAVSLGTTQSLQVALAIAVLFSLVIPAHFCRASQVFAGAIKELSEARGLHSGLPRQT